MGQKYGCNLKNGSKKQFIHACQSSLGGVWAWCRLFGQRPDFDIDRGVQWPYPLAQPSAEDDKMEGSRDDESIDAELSLRDKGHENQFRGMKTPC